MDEQTQPKRRRLNILGRAERRKRIFARLSEGWAYDEIAQEEKISGERVRQIVSEALAKRVIDQGDEYARLQLVRLLPVYHSLVLRSGAGGDASRRTFQD